MPEKEYPGTLGKSKLLPENQLKMEHSALKDGSRISFIDSLEPSGTGGKLKRVRLSAFNEPETHRKHLQF